MGLARIPTHVWNLGIHACSQLLKVVAYIDTLLFLASWPATLKISAVPRSHATRQPALWSFGKGRSSWEVAGSTRHA